MAFELTLLTAFGASTNTVWATTGAESGRGENFYNIAKKKKHKTFWEPKNNNSHRVAILWSEYTRIRSHTYYIMYPERTILMRAPSFWADSPNLYKPTAFPVFLSFLSNNLHHRTSTAHIPLPKAYHSRTTPCSSPFLPTHSKPSCSWNPLLQLLESAQPSSLLDQP